MPFKLNFRVVGVYLEFSDLPINLEPTATVKDIMTAIVGLNPSFSFQAGPTPNGKDIVSSLTYSYSGGSEQPDNSSGVPPFGSRTLDNRLETDVSRVWQYYRGARVSISGKEVDIEFPTSGQPSFSQTKLNEGYELGIDPISYSLTWRLVTIDKLPEQRRSDLDHALRRAVAGR